LGGLLRSYDRSARGLLWRRKRDASAGSPRRWAWNGILARILIINIFVLIALLAGLAAVTAWRGGLVDERIRALQVQGRIIAQVIADKATTEELTPPIQQLEASRVMSTAVVPTNTRARLFALTGEPLVDTRYLLPRNQVTAGDLPLPGAPAWTVERTLRGAANSLYRLIFWRNLELYEEGPSITGRFFSEVRQVVDRGEEGSAKRVNAKGEMIISVAVPVQRLVSVRAVLMLSTEAGDLDEAFWQDVQTLALLALAAGIFAVALSAALASNIASPIRKLSHAADRVRRGEADESAIPILTSSPDEIKALADSFRSMTAALTERLDTIENFAADVAHEIKNPLTSLRSAIETLARTEDAGRRARLMALVQNDVRRIDRLISDISEASRLDAELAREKAADVDLNAMLQTIVGLYADQDPPLPVRLELHQSGAPGGVTIRGREGGLAQVFRNILDNAISFSPKDGVIAIEVARLGSKAIVTITDQGPGIPPESVEKIFERFYTHRPQNHGFGKNSGLGLSISKQIVESHGGVIAAANRPDRTGAAFRVELPIP
jgi:two-component system sensor histidine kinase ChvG